MANLNYVRSYISFVFIALINIEVSNSVGYKNLACNQKGNCRCVQLSGDGIDLSPLENVEDPKSIFLKYRDKSFVYFFHPCSDYPVPTKEVTECSHGTSLCFFQASSPSAQELDIQAVLSNSVSGHFYSVAHAGEGVFQSSETDVKIIFKTENITTYITLECDDSSSAKSIIYPVDIHTVNSTYHNLVLKSPYSCFQNLSHHKHFMSGWAVFLIILLSIAAAYFFGGMLVLRNLKGATGTEMIPNYDFWSTLPLRIKNCCMRLTGTGSQGADTYERI